MTNRPVLLIGHSHLRAFGETRFEDEALVEIPLSREGYFGLSGPFPRQQAYWEKAIELSADRHTGIVWAGNQHTSGFLLLKDPEFDFILPDDLDQTYNLNRYFDEEKMTIPYLRVRNYFNNTLGGITWIIQKLSQQSRSRHFLVGSPPPRGDDYVQQTFTSKPEIFRKFTEEKGLELTQMGVSSPMLRLKLWAVLQSVLEDTAARSSIPFIPSVRAARSEEGFLRSELAVDLSHASTAYGVMMLEQIAEHVEMTRASL